MHVLERIKARQLLYLSLCLSAISVSAQAGSWVPGLCGDDGFCTIISVQHEVEQSAPQNPGVVVGQIDDDGFKPSPVRTTVAKQVCRKEVRVPKPVHDAVTRMFSVVVSRGGPQSLPAALTPSEQTMLLYYNTIMQQTLNFQCSR